MNFLSSSSFHFFVQSFSLLNLIKVNRKINKKSSWKVFKVHNEDNRTVSQHLPRFFIAVLDNFIPAGSTYRETKLVETSRCNFVEYHVAPHT